MSVSTIYTFLAAGASIAAIVCTVVATHYAAKEQQTEAEKTAKIQEERHAQQLTQVRAEATGGDSYCYVMVYSLGDNRFDFTLTREGRYTLYDISVRITDQNQIASKMASLDVSTASIDKVRRIQDECSRTEEIRALGPGEGELPQGGTGSLAVTVGGFVVSPEGNEFNYLVHIVARNGSWSQRIHGRKINGRWQHANHVVGSKQVDKWVALTADYPRNPDGTPQVK